jgi:hypothetical protein
MDESHAPLTPEELEDQEPALLPDREAMSVLDPLPQPVADDNLYAFDPVPKDIVGPGGAN